MGTQFPLLQLPADILEYLIMPLAKAAGARVIRSSSKVLCGAFDQMNTYLVIGGDPEEINGGEALDHPDDVIVSLIHRTSHLRRLRIKTHVFRNSRARLELPRCISLQHLDLPREGWAPLVSFFRGCRSSVKSVKLRTGIGDARTGQFWPSFQAWDALEDLSFRGSNAIDLSSLKLPPGLRRLQLGQCYRLRSLNALATCSSLESLSLAVGLSSSFDLGSISVLAPSLTSLDISYMGMNAADSVNIQPLEFLSHLTRLDFSTTPSDTVVARTELRLARLSAALNSLALTHCKISDFVPLHGCKSLRTLDLMLCSLDDRGIASLCGCTQLSILEMSMVDIVGGGGGVPCSPSGYASRFGPLRDAGVAIRDFSYSDLVA